MKKYWIEYVMILALILIAVVLVLGIQQ